MGYGTVQTPAVKERKRISAIEIYQYIRYAFVQVFTLFILCRSRGDVAIVHEVRTKKIEKPHFSHLVFSKLNRIVNVHAGAQGIRPRR